MIIGLWNSWRLISARDPDSVLGDVIVEDPAIISNHQILEKLLAVRVEEKRLTDVHSTLFLGIEGKVGESIERGLCGSQEDRDGVSWWNSNIWV